MWSKSCDKALEVTGPNPKKAIVQSLSHLARPFVSSPLKGALCDRGARRTPILTNIR